jgi:hypothetical protein
MYSSGQIFEEGMTDGLSLLSDVWGFNWKGLNSTD